MTLALGVDTGGTYTDAVLIAEETRLLASAKALTTRHDLAVGIGAAVRAVLAEAGMGAEAVSMAALSTTLATNALVEGQGGRVGLVLIGFGEKDLEAQGLAEAVAGDPVLVLPGGHDHDGRERAPLDLNLLTDWAQDQAVSAFAVAAQFATRNPAHERAAAEVLRSLTGQAVTCSHDLSARLGGPKRALTAVLNARLVGLTHGLILRAEEVLGEIGVSAPLMVVRGDGALMSAAQACAAPIETILSGPAASLVGARWLTGAEDALVSDIGGTTTDIALLRGGRPALDPQGARVGPWRTMVEAVAMRTHGLGGDSEVHARREGLHGGVTLGPRRLVPVALAAMEARELVHAALDAALASPVPGEMDGGFLRAVAGMETAGLSLRDAALRDRIGVQWCAAARVLRNRLDHAALARLWARGLVQVAGVTPTDAVHVQGRLAEWDAEAAHKALALMARRRTGAGAALAETAQAMADQITQELSRATGAALLESAFAEEEWEGAPAELARHPVLQAGLRGHRGLLALDARLAVPVVGLGASARCYYPDVGAAVRAEMILPQAGGVANAIGAVVGRIAQRQSAAVSTPSDGVFRAHLPDGPQDFATPEAAMQALEAGLGALLRARVAEAGAQQVMLDTSRDVQMVQIEGRDVFLGAEVTVEAQGRAGIAK